MKDENELLNEIYIKDFAKRMADEPSEEAWVGLMAEFVIRMDNDGTVPVPLMDMTFVSLELNPYADFDEVIPDEVIREYYFVLVGDRDGHKWMPLFTGREELQDLVNSNEVKDIPIRTVFEKACDDEHEDMIVEGIVVNPFTDSIRIPKKLAAYLLENADGRYLDAC